MPIQFTIITSTFNAGELIARTAESIRAQAHPDIQWIIIDGASTDATVAVAQRFEELISTLVSEPDSGIYDAWNKALRFISGDWVLFLGAGDCLDDAETLSNLAGILCDAPPHISLAYGSVKEVDTTGRVLRLRDECWNGLEGPWTAGRPLLPCHQGVLHRATLFSDGFKFDTRCRIASDSEIMLRELVAGNGIKLQMTVTKFLWGGVSSNRTNRLRMVAEILYINMKVGIFFRRPLYQLAVLASNAMKHIPRLLGFDRI